MRDEVGSNAISCLAAILDAFPFAFFIKPMVNMVKKLINNMKKPILFCMKPEMPCVAIRIFMFKS